MASTSATAAKQFRAVSVESDWRGCCAAAKALANQRFLAGDAPMLPLDECTQPQQCRCVYKHWSDRRSGEDRRSPYEGLGSQYHAATDRRDGNDRRG